LFFDTFVVKKSDYHRELCGGYRQPST